MTEPLFTEADVIYAVNLRDIVDDGWLDGNAGGLAPISRQFFKLPVWASPGVLSLMDHAVHEDPAFYKYESLWAYFLFRAARWADEVNESTRKFTFQRRKDGMVHRPVEIMVCVQAWAVDDPKPVVTLYLPEED